MTPEGPEPPDELERLRRRLAAEEAGNAELRSALRREREALDALRHDPWVRVARGLAARLPRVGCRAAGRRSAAGGPVRRPPASRRARSFRLVVAAPRAKVAERWGDWHLASGLAAALARRGADARVLPFDRAASAEAVTADIRLLVRGVRRAPPTAGPAHDVLWIISHPETVEDDELDAASLVLVASPRFAASLRTRTSTPVEVLLQATDPQRFRRVPPDPRFARPLAVVARTRDVLRPAVADALAAGLRPAIWGSGWERFVDPSLVVATHVANAELPALYSSVGVLLNDHWPAMAAWGFVSNRLYDALACGTTVLSDEVDEVPALFEGAVPTWSGPSQLRDLVVEALADPPAAARRAAAGRAVVLARHTFDHRAAELLGALVRHGWPPDATVG